MTNPATGGERTRIEMTDVGMPSRSSDVALDPTVGTPRFFAGAARTRQPRPADEHLEAHVDATARPRWDLRRHRARERRLAMATRVGAVEDGS